MGPWPTRGDLRKIPEEGLSAAALGEFFSKPKGPRSRAAIGGGEKTDAVRVPELLKSCSLWSDSPTSPGVQPV